MQQPIKMLAALFGGGFAAFAHVLLLAWLALWLAFLVGVVCGATVQTRVELNCYFLLFSHDAIGAETAAAPASFVVVARRTFWLVQETTFAAMTTVQRLREKKARIRASGTLLETLDARRMFNSELAEQRALRAGGASDEQRWSSPSATQLAEEEEEDAADSPLVLSQAARYGYLPDSPAAPSRKRVRTSPFIDEQQREQPPPLSPPPPTRRRILSPYSGPMWAPGLAPEGMDVMASAVGNSVQRGNAWKAWAEVATDPERDAEGVTLRANDAKNARVVKVTLPRGELIRRLLAHSDRNEGDDRLELRPGVFAFTADVAAAVDGDAAAA